MTAAINTPALWANSQAQETTFEDREPCTTAGNFARLMDLAVRAPGAKSRKAAERTQTDAALSDEEKDSETDEISNQPVVPEDKNAPAAPPPAWLAGISGTGFGQPIPTCTQPTQAEAQHLSALPEDSGLADSARDAGLTEPAVGSASFEPASSILQPAFTEPKPSGPDAGEKRGLAAGGSTLADDENNVLAAERLKTEDGSLNGNDFPVDKSGESRAAVSEGGAGNATTAIPSDSRPAVAGSSRAPVVAEPSVHEQALMTAVSDRGTLAAQQTGTMEATHEMNETACLAEQNMPCLPAAIEAAAPAGRERKTRTQGVDYLAGFPAGAAEIALALADQSPRRELSTYADVATPQTVGVEGVRRAIENAAVTLRRMDASSMSLVLTPDGNTQLALHVELQQGRFEVRAVLERGDFSALGAEWSQLQNRLAEQGVRLAPLVSGPGAGNAFAGGSSFSGQRGREEMLSGELPMPALGKTEARKSGARTVNATNGRAWWA